MLEYYDIHGDPINEEKWRHLCCDQGYKTIANESIHVADGCIHVQCLWDGRAEQYGPGGPMIFRTKVIKAIRCQRMETEETQHCTEQAAWEHFKELVRTHTPDPDMPESQRNRWDQILDDV